MTARARDHTVSHRGYRHLVEDEDELEPRASFNSSSPILPKEQLEEDTTYGLRDQGATFDTDGLELHYRPIKDYEGAHRFDPSYTWSPKDEKEVVWKVYTPHQVSFECSYFLTD